MQYKKQSSGKRRYQSRRSADINKKDDKKTAKRMSFEKRTFIQSVVSAAILVYCIGISYSNTAVVQKEFIAHSVNITANKSEARGYLNTVKRLTQKGADYAKKGVDRIADLCTPKAQDKSDKALTALAMKDDNAEKKDNKNTDKEPHADTDVTDKTQQSQTAQAAQPNDYANTLTVPIKGKITSGYGDRIHPVSGESTQHMGVDIAADYGTVVTACKKGFVTEAGYDSNLGNYVKIDHGGGIVTVYGHLSEISVKPGEYADKSIKIGCVGQTGVATGPHLHLEIRVNGKCQNPADYIEGIL